MLASELITGKVQVGDTTFEQRTAAKIAVAGDPTNTGPTYADLASLSPSTTSALASIVTRSLTATGQAGTFAIASNYPLAVIAAFDDTTKHNVPQVFADYRTKVGVTNIGYAITEPVWVNVKVGGASKDVLVQAFERRVLTYTPSNPDGSQVEMGNIGQHYYQWRYTTSAAPTATVVPTPKPSVQPTTTAPSVPTTVPAVGTTFKDQLGRFTVRLPARWTRSRIPKQKTIVSNADGCMFR